METNDQNSNNDMVKIHIKNKMLELSLDDFNRLLIMSFKYDIKQKLEKFQNLDINSMNSSNAMDLLALYKTISDAEEILLLLRNEKK